MATAVIHTIAAAEAQHMSDEETVYWPKLRERMTAEEMEALYDRLVSGRTLGMAARLALSAADRACARGPRCCLELFGLLRIPLCEASVHHIPGVGGPWSFTFTFVSRQHPYMHIRGLRTARRLRGGCILLGEP
jgi:hypothetical protein